MAHNQKYGPSERGIRSQINNLVNKFVEGMATKKNIVERHHTATQGKLTFAAIGLSDLELVELVMSIESIYDIQIPDIVAADARFGPDDIIELIFLRGI